MMKHEMMNKLLTTVFLLLLGNCNFAQDTLNVYLGSGFTHDDVSIVVSNASDSGLERDTIFDEQATSTDQRIGLAGSLQVVYSRGENVTLKIWCKAAESVIGISDFPNNAAIRIDKRKRDDQETSFFVLIFKLDGDFSFY